MRGAARPYVRSANHTGPCRSRNAPSCTPTCRSPRAQWRSHEPAVRRQAPADPAHGSESLDEDACATAVARSSSPVRSIQRHISREAGGQDEIASQTHHSEIRLLDTLNATAIE